MQNTALIMNGLYIYFFLNVRILPEDTSCALIRLLSTGLELVVLVPEAGIPIWLTLLRGRGCSTLRTPNGADLEVILVFFESFDLRFGNLHSQVRGAEKSCQELK